METLTLMFWRPIRNKLIYRTKQVLYQKQYGTRERGGGPSGAAVPALHENVSYYVSQEIVLRLDCFMNTLWNMQKNVFGELFFLRSFSHCFLLTALQLPKNDRTRNMTA